MWTRISQQHYTFAQADDAARECSGIVAANKPGGEFMYMPEVHLDAENDVLTVEMWRREKDR